MVSKPTCAQAGFETVDFVDASTSGVGRLDTPFSEVEGRDPARRSPLPQ
jgi:hypothetical protein